MVSNTDRLPCEICLAEPASPNSSPDGVSNAGSGANSTCTSPLPQTGSPCQNSRDAGCGLPAGSSLRRSKSLPILYEPRLSFADGHMDHNCQAVSPALIIELAIVQEFSISWELEPFELSHICALAPTLPTCALGHAMSDTHNHQKISVLPLGMPYMCGWSSFGLVFTTPFFSIVPYLFPKAPHQLFELAELRMGAVAANPVIRHNIAMNEKLQLVPSPASPTHDLARYWAQIEQECTELMVHSFVTVLPALVPLVMACGRLVLKLIPQSRHAETRYLFAPQQALGPNVDKLYELTAFVCQSLRDSCAPIRDSWVKAMKIEFEAGFDEHDPQRFVRGLKIFVALVNVMNLDMINYQLRLHRRKLVNGLVHVERQYFKEQQAFDKSLIKEVTLWLTSVPEDTELSSALIAVEQRYSNVLSKLVVGFLTSIRSRAPTLPRTFSLDQERVQQLQFLLMELVKQMRRGGAPENDYDNLVAQWAQGFSLHDSNIYLLLETKIVDLLVEKAQDPLLWKSKVNPWTKPSQDTEQRPTVDDCAAKVVCLLRLHWNSASFIYIAADSQRNPSE